MIKVRSVVFAMRTVLQRLQLLFHKALTIPLKLRLQFPFASKNTIQEKMILEDSQEFCATAIEENAREDRMVPNTMIYPMPLVGPVVYTNHCVCMKWTSYVSIV